MAAVVLLDSLADQEAKPDIKGNGRVLDEFLETSESVEVAFLDDVRRVDTSSDTGIEPKRDHASEAVAVSFEQLGDGNAVAGRSTRDQIRDDSRGWRHVVQHSRSTASHKKWGRD